MSCYLCGLCDAELKVKLLHPKAKAPTKREEDSGYDIYGIIEEEIVVLAPGDNIIIPTGLAMEFPKGLGFIVENRGSVGTKSALVGACVVDSGYRGEVKLDIHNVSNTFLLITDVPEDQIPDYCENYKVVSRSNALAQGIIVPTFHLPVKVVEELSESVRKDGAFGSTNIKSNSSN